MKKIALIVVLSGFTFSLTSAKLPITDIQQTTSTVYICNGKYAKKYHYKKDCRGLSNCKASIISMTKIVAQKKGKTLCGHED